MPVVSIFFGIVIRMFYREHGAAHFHAEHQGQQATFTLDGGFRRWSEVTEWSFFQP